MDRSRFKGTTSFLDMLWILLACYGAMFIIAFLLIQPPAKNADIIKKAEYIIVLEWEHDKRDDIDLWVKNPRGEIVSFRNKTAGFMNLEKDDLGTSNDKITDEYGNTRISQLNRETITLRGVTPGEYSVMVHVYSKIPWNNYGERDFSVEIIKINPYKTVYLHKGKYSRRGQELSVARFTVDSDAELVSFNLLPSNFITAKLPIRETPVDEGGTRTWATSPQP